MKHLIKILLVVLFAVGSINIAMADDNYHGNDVAGMQTTPTIIAGLNNHTFNINNYDGNDVSSELAKPTIVLGLDSHTFDNDEYEGND